MSYELTFNNTDNYTTDYVSGSTPENVTFTANEGFSFSEIEMGEYDYSQGGVFVSYTYTPTKDVDRFNENGTKFYYNSSMFESETGFGGGSLSVTPVVIELTSPKNITLNVINNDPVDFTTTYSGELLSSDDVVEFNAVEGFTFFQIKTSGYDYGEGGIPRELIFNIDDAGAENYFSNENKTFIFPIGEFTNLQFESGEITINIIMNDDSSVPIPYTSSMLEVYRISSKQLIEFNNKRWDSEINFDDIIYSLYSIPFKLDETLLTENTIPVMLRNIDSGIRAKAFKDDKIIINAGLIDVPLIYDNVFDYRGVECKIYVPYGNPININSEYVIGQQIGLFYSIDIINDKSTIYITSDKIGGVIEKQDILLTRKIPYTMVNYLVPNNEIGAFIYNDVLTPYIEVIRDIPINDSIGIFGRQTRQYGAIGDYSGYIEVDNVKLETSSTANEQKTIKNLLREGVFIK